MAEERNIKIKKILSILLILIGTILLFNTNSNPNSFLIRIFKPIKINGGRFYYANILHPILIYYGFKGVYKYGESTYFETTGKRIIWVIIIYLFISKFSTPIIKTAKSMSKGLNAIYYNREDNNRGLDFSAIDDDKVIVNYTFELENCSKDVQQFHIKLLFPEFHGGYVSQEEFIFEGDEIDKEPMITMAGKEIKKFKLNFIVENELKRSNFSGNAEEFEFILYNDNEKVEFINEI